MVHRSYNQKSNKALWIASQLGSTSGHRIHKMEGGIPLSRIKPLASSNLNAKEGPGSYCCAACPAHACPLNCYRLSPRSCNDPHQGNGINLGVIVVLACGRALNVVQGHKHLKNVSRSSQLHAGCEGAPISTSGGNDSHEVNVGETSRGVATLSCGVCVQKVVTGPASRASRAASTTTSSRSPGAAGGTGATCPSRCACTSRASCGPSASRSTCVTSAPGASCTPRSSSCSCSTRSSRVTIQVGFQDVRTGRRTLANVHNAKGSRSGTRAAKNHVECKARGARVTGRSGCGRRSTRTHSWINADTT